VLYYTDYRFYLRILENSWILIEKNRYFKNKIFSEFQLLLFAFNYFSIFWQFFFILPVYGFQKILKIIVLFYCINLRFYQKIMQNYGFFFKKKIKICEIQIFNKIPLFTICFYFFSFFCIFFSISPIQTCQKIIEFLVVFYWKD